MPRRKKSKFHDAYYRSSLIYTCTPLIAGLIVSAGMASAHAFFGPDDSSAYHFHPLKTPQEAISINNQVVYNDTGCGFVWDGCEEVCFNQLDLRKCVLCGRREAEFGVVDGQSCRD